MKERDAVCGTHLLLSATQCVIYCNTMFSLEFVDFIKDLASSCIGVERRVNKKEHVKHLLKKFNVFYSCLINDYGKKPLTQFAFDE